MSLGVVECSVLSCFVFQVRKQLKAEKNSFPSLAQRHFNGSDEALVRTVYHVLCWNWELVGAYSGECHSGTLADGDHALHCPPEP